jgi:hypothetical protein
MFLNTKNIEQFPTYLWYNIKRTLDGAARRKAQLNIKKCCAQIIIRISGMDRN